MKKILILLFAFASLMNAQIYFDGEDFREITDTLEANIWYNITITTNTPFNLSNATLGKVGSGYFDGGIGRVIISDKKWNNAMAKFWFNSYFRRFPTWLLVNGIWRDDKQFLWMDEFNWID